ncbi:phage terminase large subunit family protein [Pseudooceanicola sp. CBS1P-1]|uniref:Phage terminase large subunit family protein n=1 Tax=Pseudooceanicola albus TaxID=2692189 RepID=A0A6L7G611_9RHOB|nr:MULTISPECIES: phage terminase large subunit family protein [Pseudooceanicola]MBT9385633.1 phage terminase large subunit family protein [Pseudooceanicola endophyticus]MXN18957.1 phage terminase large subunit family protein [Pseudooceanicola albus]
MQTDLLDQVTAKALRALIPPPRLRLSEWIEANVYLPEGVSAQPGLVELWPFQREIADAIGDPTLERVTLVKPVRVGFTTLLTSAVASFVANEPAPILCVLPAEADCRDYIVSDVEPIFGASPAVSKALAYDIEGDDRNTLTSRRFPGGSLKVVAAKAPRNLRRHNVRVLFMDEVDGMEPTPEGSPILLAEKRTLSFPDRKIVLGSTPVHEDTSNVLRAFAESDARVFEVPCPECGAHAEILWDAILWDEGQPETARWQCPHCAAEIPERYKRVMVEHGVWRATRPEVKGHAGFQLNALVSLHANASWPQLVREFLVAKKDPTTLQTFVNTILGQGWTGSGDELDDGELASRAEAFGLDALPESVLVVTAGIDTQHDRLEITFTGFDQDETAYVLGHEVIWGNWDDERTWADLDTVLKARWPHPLGGSLGLEAAVIDAGDGVTMEAVMAFCGPRARRRIMAGKGVSGTRKYLEPSRSRRPKETRLWLIGVDGIKTAILARLARPGSIRFSDSLPPVWFEQLVSERAVVRYVRGQPQRRFERVPGRRAEALDCFVYSLAARQAAHVNFAERAEQLKAGGIQNKLKPRNVIQSKFITG